VSVVLALLVAVAGGAGAACRFLVDSWVRARARSDFPTGTMIVNLSGSLVLGFLVGLVAAGVLPDTWRQVAGVGFLGGYTTFSTAAVEAVRLARDRRGGRFLAVSAGMLVAGVGLAGIGLALGALVGLAAVRGL
jgi:CrcB protein